MQFEPILNLAAWIERSVVNGPGERFVIWVQGCPIHCPGCINPELWPIEPNHQVPVSEMATLILSTPGIEGVTISGGEPTLQIEALLALAKLIQERGLTILCYSGYTLDELRTRGDVLLNEFLEYIDILIDGPFLEAQSMPLPYRGSCNQRIHFLHHAPPDWIEETSELERKIELISSGTDWKITGNWDENFLLRLKEILVSEKWNIEKNKNTELEG
jgi:anaerobic ribonucleoside-triphosphate reductase activating protein